MNRTAAPLLATAFAAVASAALFALFPAVPPLTYFAAVAAPLPVAHLAWNTSALHAAAAVLLSALLLAVGIDPAFAAQYLIPFGIAGIAVGTGVRREWRPERIIGLIGLAAITVFAAYLGVQAVRTGVSPAEYLKRAAAEEMEPLRKALSGEKLDPETLLGLESALEQAQNLMGRAAPGIVAGFSILTGWLNALWLRRMLARKGVPLSSWAGWRAPEAWIFGLIAAGGLTALGSGPFAAAGLNLLIPLGLVYFLQGLAIVEYLFEAGSTSRLLRGIVYVVVFMQLEITAPALALAGAFDQWIDFRGRWAPPAGSAGAGEKQKNSFRDEGGPS